MRREEKIFETYLKQVGLFLTKERLAILNAVFSWHHHFDVDRIYDHFVQKGMVLSKATIYRTLPLLLEANLIKKAVSASSKEVYEHTFGHPEHFHFVCSRCGAIYEKELQEIKKPIADVAKEIGFGPENYRIEIYGSCKKCREKALRSVKS